MNQVLDNIWEDMVEFYVECSEWNKGMREKLDFFRSLAIERKITIYDAVFIVLYGDAKVNDKEFYRRLN